MKINTIETSRLLIRGFTKDDATEIANGLIEYARSQGAKK